MDLKEQKEITQNELLPFFKALADGNRLRIVGLLSDQELSVEQLAEMLGLRPSTISHHLSKLAEVGLVSARPDSYYNLYRLEPGVLEKMAKRLLIVKSLPAMAGDVNRNAYDQKVVHDYSRPNGSLKTIPAQRKKLEAVLRYILQDFKPGVRYSEREVNQILVHYHEDTATLRRELIGSLMLQRDHGIYWRQEKEE